MSPTYVVIGTPFSTFTRAITSALYYKGIRFEQKATSPHSELARKYHPFGFLPSLVVTEGNRSLTLCESQAIARYIDRVSPSSSLTSAQLELPEKLWELVSIIAAHGFNAVEVQVVKPRVNSVDQGQESPEACRARIESSGGVQGLCHFFRVIENLRTEEGPYLLGGNPTWPDFFLYPLVADLLATPDADLAPPSILSWAESMQAVKGIIETHKGTLADGGRP